MPSFQESQVVRLRNLKLLQAIHEGSLAVLQEYLPSKGQWRVRLNTGAPLEVATECLKVLDNEDDFAEGEVVRVKAKGVKKIFHDGALVAVQQYLPMKDMWRVRLPSGEAIELYSECMKKVDSERRFNEGEVVRLVSKGLPLKALPHTGELVAVQQYLPTKDLWQVRLNTGSALEVPGESLTTLSPPDAFAEGDLAYYTGGSERALVAIQQYLPHKDVWVARLNTGAPVEAHLEDLEKQDNAPGHALDDLISSPPPVKSGSGRGGYSSMFKGLFKEREKGAGDRGGFTEGETVHLQGGWRHSEGTMGLLQEYLDGKGKWRVRLNTGEAVEVASKELHPSIDPRQYREMQLVTITAGKHEGTLAAIQQPLEDKGQWRVRLPNGKPLDLFPSSFTPAAGSTPHTEQPAPLHTPTHQPPMAEQPRPSSPLLTSSQEAALLDELRALLRERGVEVEEVAGYNDKDLDELLKDELQLGVIKRNKIKKALRQSVGGAPPPRPPAKAPHPTPEPIIDLQPVSPTSNFKDFLSKASQPAKQPPQQQDVFNFLAE